MLYYTRAFCLTYGMGRVYKNREHIFDTKNNGKIVPVDKLHHAKVVMVDGIHERNRWHALVPVSHRRVVIFPEKTLGRSIRGEEGVLGCCCSGACLRC